jgi:hypothetical protein
VNELPARIRDAFGRIRGVTPSTVKHFGDFCNAPPRWRQARYGVFDSALYRMKNVEWQFPQEIATFSDDRDVNK